MAKDDSASQGPHEPDETYAGSEGYAEGDEDQHGSDQHGGDEYDDFDDFDDDYDEDDPEAVVTRRGRRKRRRRGILIVTSILLVLTLAVVGVVGAYLYRLNDALSDITRAPLLPTENMPERPAEAGESMNYLLLGDDHREEARGRSDVIMIAHVNSDRSKVTFIHFPRDYFVEIAGSGKKGKINSSYAFGGTPALVETLQPLIGVPIDHVAQIDFEGFKDMTDAVGGVTVTNPHASDEFPEGRLQLDGERGLAFVRERYALEQGDISRGERQQEYLKALLLKGLSKDVLMNPLKFADFVEATTPYMTVDEQFDNSTIRSRALEMRNIRGSDIEFVTAPWKGIGMEGNAGSVVYPDEGQLKKLSEALRTDDLENYQDDVSPKSGFGG